MNIEEKADFASKDPSMNHKAMYPRTVSSLFKHYGLKLVP